MPGAALRNCVPRKMAIPASSDEYGGLWVHEVRANEAEGFNIHESTHVIREENKYWSFSFLGGEGKDIQVLFTYDYFEHGQPNRGAYRRPIFKLGSGDVGILHINGRFTSYSGQWYKQNFVNIANVDTVEPGVFLVKKEKYFVDKMVHLF